MMVDCDRVLAALCNWLVASLALLDIESPTEDIRCLDDDNNELVVDVSGSRFTIFSFIRTLSDVDTSTTEARIDSFVFVMDVRMLVDALATVSFALLDIISAVSVARRDVLSFARLAIWDAAVDADDAKDENRLDIFVVAFLDSVVVTVVDGDVAAVLLPTDDVVDDGNEVNGVDADDCGDELLHAKDLLLQRNSKNDTRLHWCTIIGGANSLILC